MNWDEVVHRVTPYVVKIETPVGHGTGFLCLYTEGNTFCGIATANHVVAHADDWQQPIRVHHQSSKAVALIKEEKRVIFTDPIRDSALLLVDPSHFQLPEALVPLLPLENILPIGVDVGWIGYPAVRRYSQCFFSGRISAFDDYRHAYLIDGVAINGVSGGPVLYSDGQDSIHIIGSVSSYIANRATGEALPGLSVAQDVSHLHEIAKHIRTIEEARTAQAAEAAKQKRKSEEEAATSPNPTTPPPGEPPPDEDGPAEPY